ncbi:helix-turn-helix domain-containing protein, partial [Turicimonas muris]
MESDKKFRLEDLAELTGIPRRTIRFYIQKGYVAPPLGQKRGAYYTNEHLEELLKIKRLS